ncbi:MAG: Cof-type HAD-IIB family hydrolase [Micrococcales bacterium]|nr:Cof-type HAD-IIB family hydrolase [Micrococcales bacterium]
MTRFNDEVSPAVYDAVQRLRASGIHLVLATGRGTSGTLAAAKSLDLDDVWVASSNGAMIGRLDSTHPRGFEVVELVTIDPRPVGEAVRAAYPTARFAREDWVEGWLLSEPFPTHEIHPPRRIAPIEDVFRARCPRLIVRAPDLNRDEMAALLASLNLEGVHFDIGWSAWADVTAEGVSKAAALENIRARLGVAPEGTVAVGDGSNDIPMLAWASRGVAMGGSSPPVIRAASEVAPTIEDDGVAWLIDTILA